jgi:thiosulfate reductase cytochrome b subunit
MATDKRERQRQNRAVKQAAENKAKRRQKVFYSAKRVAIWGIVFVVLVIIANVVWS